MVWKIPRIWEGGECWIIGGGPSFPRQFGVPEELITEVITGKKPLDSFSSYFSFLHDKHVIGVNAAFLLGKWVDILFFGDRGFYFKNRREIIQWGNIRVTCSKPLRETAEKERLKYIPKDGNTPKGISSRTNFISWNGNSGAAAINLAVHFGVKKIYLLGFDMDLGVDNKQHWHGVYKTSKAPLKPHKLPFERHLQGFPKIAQDAKRLGIDIINVSPNSKIQDFKKVSLKELL